MLITVVGICVGSLVTVLAAYWGIVAARRSGRGRIGLYILDCFYPYGDVAGVFDSFVIRFGDAEASPNTAIVKACLVNTSATEIDRDQILKPLTVHLPQGYKWLKAKVSSSSPDVTAAHEIPDERSLAFRWDLLRPGEYFQFHAVVETPAGSSANEARSILADSVVTHRITHTDQTRVAPAPTALGNKRYIRRRTASAAIAATVGALLLASVLWLQLSGTPSLYAPTYSLVSASGATGSATLQARGQWEYAIVDQQEKTAQVVDVRSPQNEPLLVEVGVEFRQDAKVAFGWVSLLAGILFGQAAITLLEVRRNRMLADILVSAPAAGERAETAGK